MDGKRLLHLDGLRGLAVLMVLAFHYLSRFPGFYPYGKSFSDAGIYGFFGVEMFFIISGFVIALTLRRCAGVLDFAVRRVARLWPPMLVCSILTFALMHAIDSPFTQARRVGLEGFLPSLTFIGPGAWEFLVPQAEWIDGAYWSLFVEVRFYFWAAVIYFVAARHFSAILLAASLIAFGVNQLLPEGTLKTLWDTLFFPEYLPLFAAGAIFFEFWRGENRAWHWPALGVLLGLCLYAEYAPGVSPVRIAMLLACFAPFVLAILWPAALRPFEAKPFVWLGRRSYSLYLLHQNIGVALIALIAPGYSSGIYIAVIVAVSLLMIGFAHLVFERVEQRSGAIAKAILARTGAGKAFSVS